MRILVDTRSFTYLSSANTSNPVNWVAMTPFWRLMQLIYCAEKRSTTAWIPPVVTVFYLRSPA